MSENPPVAAQAAADAVTRSNRAEVRNPMIAIPEVQAFLDLPPPAQQALRAALLAFSRVCRERSKKSWATRKAPLAAYWYANAVNSAHLARAIPRRAEKVGAPAPRVERQRGG